jgi:dephospho-CoA kinase
MLFGVTGGIGSGKSEVCALLDRKGVRILRADQIAKQLTSTLPEIRNSLKKEFGEDIYLTDNSLNIKRMRDVVFNDERSRMRVNEIIHPHVLHFIKTEAERLERQENAALIAVEAALIFESGMEKWLDAVVVVTAPEEIRTKRIMQRDSLEREDVRARIQAQMPENELVAKADYTLENIGSVRSLQKSVDLLYDRLISNCI